MTKKVLIIGNGSIGRRHREVLTGMGHETAFVSRHTPGAFKTVGEAFSSAVFDAVVISNQTSEHAGALSEIDRSGFRGRILVEKPLAKTAGEVVPPANPDVYAGYVLRFHPGVIRMAELLVGRKVLSVDCYCGQYLPDWRPGSDYRNCYSASRELGGGVLRDLSHEVDLLSLLSGGINRVAAVTGHFSGLEIDSDDIAMLLSESASGVIGSCRINYLDRNVGRRYQAEYEGGSISLDMIGGRLVHNGSVETFALARNDMFHAMYLDLFSERPQRLCSFHEAMAVMKVIDAAEKASSEKKWVWL